MFGLGHVGGLHQPLAGAILAAYVLLCSTNGHEHGSGLEQFSALTCKA